MMDGDGSAWLFKKDTEINSKIRNHNPWSLVTVENVIVFISPILSSLRLSGLNDAFNYHFSILYSFVVQWKTTPFHNSESISESKRRISVVAKATGESSESSLSLVKSVQNVWDKSEDRIALIGLGFTSIVALWASTNLVAAIDKLPLVPSTLELIGILFTSWFIYRYLLFKPDREELLRTVNKSISDILGQ